MRFNFLQLGQARGAQEAPSLTPGPGTLPPQTSMLPPLFCQLRGGPEKFCLARGHPAVGRLSRLCCGPLAFPPPPAPQRDFPHKVSTVSRPMNSGHPLGIAPPGLSGRQGPPEPHSGRRERLSTQCSRRSWVEAASVVLNQDTVPL